MAYLGFREFVALLEKEGELHRVKREVDWNLEMGNIMWKVYATRGPAVLFEKVKDSEIPLVSGAMAGIKRYALGLQTTPHPRSLTQKILHCTENPVAPVMVERGYCQDNTDTGDNIDIYKFPSPRWHHLDGGRFIGTLGVVITRDPETGIRNMAIIREQVQGKNKMGLLAHQDTAIHLRKYQAMKKPMPVATAIGVPPSVLAAAPIQAAYGQDELGIAGALAGEPIRLVKCKSIDLEVPADSEIVLEGEIPPDDSRWEDEGPFGEFFGYTTTKIVKRPTIYLTAVTYRNNPVFQGTSPGVPVPLNEDATLKLAGHSAAVWSALNRAGVPGVKEVYSTASGGCCHMVRVSMNRQFYLGNARQVIDAVWGTSRTGYGKWVIVVDDDIDIYDDEQVNWALATRVQPHRDIIVTNNRLRGNLLDPSIHPDVREYPNNQSSRIGIDATQKFKGFEFPPVVRPAQKEIQELERKWKEYGFK